MRKINSIIVHCSDSTWGDRAIIDVWHKKRGWNEGGYHFVILNGQITPSLNIRSLNGSIELGRDIKKVGAHCLGYNNNSIGICMIGKKHFTEEQITNLVSLIIDLMALYNIPIENVLGHYETPKANGKTCPNIDMKNFRNIIKKKTGLFYCPVN